jgi:DNA polymerase-1
MGREIRKAFIAKEGCVLVSADYSQIELRVLAHLSGDEAMTRAFFDGGDIHAKTAAEVFDVPEEMVTPEQRSAAKAVNFGIVYGISDFGLARNLGIPRKQAASYIEKYFATYPGIKQYMAESVKKAKTKGYAETMFGRRRAMPELKSSNYNIRTFGERVAMNMPIQGTAADIIKLAMNKIHTKLNGLETKLILQIHDELVLEAPEKEAQVVAKLLVKVMERAAKMNVPLPSKRPSLKFPW